MLEKNSTLQKFATISTDDLTNVTGGDIAKEIWDSARDFGTGVIDGFDGHYHSHKYRHRDR